MLPKMIWFRRNFCFRSNSFILILFTCTYLCYVKSCEIKYVKIWRNMQYNLIIIKNKHSLRHNMFPEWSSNESHQEKTCFLLMQKQRSRSAARLQCS